VGKTNAGALDLETSSRKEVRRPEANPGCGSRRGSEVEVVRESGDEGREGVDRKESRIKRSMGEGCVEWGGGVGGERWG